MKDFRIGEVHTNNTGETFTIIKYKSYKNIDVKFSDGTIITNREYKECEKGTIKNPMTPTILGIGYFGIGKYKSRDNLKNKTLYYTTWMNILQRCYNEKYYLKYPTYRGCSLDNSWHNFQNFAEWYEENYNSETMQSWHLDKDILVKGNKVYSPETCCFVPQEVNSLLSLEVNKLFSMGLKKTKNGKFQVRLCVNGVTSYLGVYQTEKEAFDIYKTAKEERIVEVANKWKSKISEKAYQALINYKL